ncbi:MAG: cation:proton antiporter [Gordonia amarae]
MGTALIVASSPTPFIAPGALTTLFTQVAVLLGAAIAFGWLARRLGLPAVTGELVVGIVLGPSILGEIWPALQHGLFPADTHQQQLTDAIGQLGVVLLVGLAGAELDLAFVRRQTRLVSGVGIGAFVFPLAAGVGAGILLPTSMRADGSSTVALSLLLGAALSVSAIPIIAKILSEMGMLHRNVGQVILAAATTNDAVAWILVSVTASMATVGVNTGDIAAASIGTLGAFVVAIVILRPAVQPLLRRLEESSAAVYLAPVSAVVIVGCAAATQALGLEAILGAFLAGIVIGPRKPWLMAPLNTVTLTILVPIFLATAGLRVDLSLLTDPVVALATVTVVAVAVVSKFAGAYLGARMVRQTHWEATAIGAGLNARGAIEIVIAMVGLRLGIFSPSIFAIVVIVAIVTSVMAPPALKYAMARVTSTSEEQIRQELRSHQPDPEADGRRH